MNASKYTLSLTTEVTQAIETEAKALNTEPAIMLKEIVENHVISAGYLEKEHVHSIALYRWLSTEVATAAEHIVTKDGFSEHITALAIKECQQRPVWIRKYEEYIQGDPFGKGNPRKKNINPNFGFIVKTRLGANIKNRDGKRITAKAKQLVITDYSLLVR